MVTVPNPPVEHLVIYAPRSVGRELSLGLYEVMARRGKVPAFSITRSRKRILAHLSRWARAGVILAGGGEENQSLHDWLRELRPGAKLMTLKDEETVPSCPFSYIDVYWRFPVDEEDYQWITTWFGITPYSDGIPDYRIEDTRAVPIETLRAERTAAERGRADGRRYLKHTIPGGGVDRPRTEDPT